MNQLTTIASLPMGSGCLATLPPEVGKARSEGLTTVEEVLTRSAVEEGQPVPWESTHNSLHTETWDGRRWLHRGLAKLPDADFTPFSQVTALGSEAPAIAVGPHHHPDDGRGLRDVYVDGVLMKYCEEADTAQGWAIVLKDPRPGEFAPDGWVRWRVCGKVEVVPAGATPKPSAGFYAYEPDGLVRIGDAPQTPSDRQGFEPRDYAERN